MAVPIFLQPLIDSTLQKYPPSEGALTCEDDREVIQRLTTKLLRGHVSAPRGYKGDFNKAGERHGHGMEVFDNGEVYAGQWSHGRHHGYGVFTWLNGDRYDGQWRDGQMHGHALHVYADGGQYCGWMSHGMREGRGTFIYSSGDELQGIYS